MSSNLLDNNQPKVFIKIIVCCSSCACDVYIKLMPADVIAVSFHVCCVDHVLFFFFTAPNKIKELTVTTL